MKLTEQDLKAEYLFSLVIKAITETQTTYPLTTDYARALRSSMPEIARCFLGVSEIGKTNTGYWINRFLEAGKCAPGNSWCAGFGQFCIQEACKALGLPDILPYDSAGTQAIGNWLIKNGLVLKDIRHAKPGDFIIWTQTSDPRFGHWSTIENTDEKFVYTIDGNTSSTDFRNGGTVARKKFKLSECEIGKKQPSKYVKCVGDIEAMYRKAVTV